jgi:hypothetical protein
MRVAETGRRAAAHHPKHLGSTIHAQMRDARTSRSSKRNGRTSRSRKKRRAWKRVKRPCASAEGRKAYVKLHR